MSYIILRIREIGMLVISDDELNVGDNEVASSEVGGGTRRNLWDADPVSQPRFPEDGGLQKHIILNYNYYIHILLIITNPLIYICHILCGG